MIGNKENILIIAYNDLNNSGVPNVIYQIIKAQHESYNFDILVFGNNLYYYEKLRDEGINNITVFKSGVKKPFRFFAKAFFVLFLKDKKYYFEMKKLLKNKKYTAIHSFKEYDSGPFLKAAKKMGINRRIIHTTVIHESSRSIITKISKKRSLKYGDTFVGVTELACQNAFPKKDYQVIHFSYDENKFNMKANSTLKSDCLVLTQVATYSSNKNQLFSIEIMKYLKPLHQKTKLKLIGKETELGYQSKMKEAIEVNGLQNEVELIDGSKGVGNNLENTSYSLLTSLKEGASLVVVESQACGITIFASSIVSKEMNVGGVQYLDLKKGPKYWAEKINSYFQKHGNERNQYDLSSFSKESFKEGILRLYRS